MPEPLSPFILSPRENGAMMDGETDDTVALAATITQARSTDKALWIDRPLRIGNPTAITIFADVTTQFVGEGAFLWSFGTVHEARIRLRGSFTATPTITGPAGVTLAATFRLATVTPAARGTGYTPRTGLTLVGGSFTAAGEARIETTRLVTQPTVASGGTGYVDGTGRRFAIEGGEGAPATLLCTVVGGIVTAVTGIEFTGAYTKNPTSPAATRRLDGGGGSGLTVSFPANAFGVDTLAVSATAPGDYTTVPTATIATTGGGNGATVTTTFELATVTASGGSGFTTVPPVTISPSGGAAIVLTGDRPTFTGRSSAT